MSTTPQFEPTIEPGPTKSGSPLLRGVAWALIIGLGGCLLASISADAAGLRVGSASAYLQQPRRAAAPPEPLADGSAEPLPGTTITVWFLKGPRFFSADTIFADDLSRGRTQDGELAYHIQFSEEGFNQYMSYWFFPSDEDLKPIVEGIRDPHIDLTPGGLTLYADVKIGDAWKPAGLLYELDENATLLKFRALQIDGTAVTTLPDSFLDKDVGGTIERLANHALSDLAFIDDQTGEHLSIHQIYIDDDKAEVLAQAGQ
jgi:hypothetical protein